MQIEAVKGWIASLLLWSCPAFAQANAPAKVPDRPGDVVAAPLPDPTTLLQDVERNQTRLEALQRNYTYHVHTDEQDLDKQGGVKKTQTEDAESLTIDGVRINRVVARNGKPLTPEEQQKESERIDKEGAKAKERRAKIRAKGGDTDERGDPTMPLSRVLELGSFSNPRRLEQNGRQLIALDYAGNPQAKTRSMFEGVMRDVVGTVWIDETDRVLVAAQGRFLNDFKLGAGMLADVRKGTSFAFKTTRGSDGVWLPADIQGQGSVRFLLFANFNGRLHAVTSDYRQFRTNATIVGSHGVIGPDGEPVAAPSAGSGPTDPPQAPAPASAVPHR